TGRCDRFRAARREWGAFDTMAYNDYLVRQSRQQSLVRSGERESRADDPQPPSSVLGTGTPGDAYVLGRRYRIADGRTGGDLSKSCGSCTHWSVWRLLPLADISCSKQTQGRPCLVVHGDGLGHGPAKAWEPVVGTGPWRCFARDHGTCARCPG